MQACDLSATEARLLIGSKKLSPVELLDSCLQRVEQVNAQVNGVVAIGHERARQDAKAAEQAVMRGETLGLLHGLTIGIKDTVNSIQFHFSFGEKYE
ncbi:MAG: amidase family protein [Polaromonas sp.]|nr:amidase family protein [Polaromonas sp.]